nr:hypothetical protein GCM10020093_013790 [Planobispora longispora]
MARGAQEGDESLRAVAPGRAVASGRAVVPGRVPASGRAALPVRYGQHPQPDRGPEAEQPQGPAPLGLPGGRRQGQLDQGGVVSRPGPGGGPLQNDLRRLGEAVQQDLPEATGLIEVLHPGRAEVRAERPPGRRGRRGGAVHGTGGRHTQVRPGRRVGQARPAAGQPRRRPQQPGDAHPVPHQRVEVGDDADGPLGVGVQGRQAQQQFLHRSTIGSPRDG